MKITFKTNQYFILNEKVNIPIPDGYHYSNSGSGGNAGWFYVVPKDVSLEKNHIDAMPLSFGVTASKIGDFPFDAERIDAITQLMIMTGYMNNDAATVVPVICSEHCGFLFQSWTDPSDATFNKINGFLFAGDELYQFHVYANHPKEIAHEPKTIEDLVSVVMSWMKKVYLCGEEPASLEPRVSVAADSIKVSIHTLVEIENRLHTYIGGALDFKNELIELIVAAGVMLYQANGIESDEMLTNLLSEITESYSIESLKAIQASNITKVKGYTAHKLLEQYESGFVVNQLVKCDKILKTSIQNGATALLSELLCAYLEYLCAEAGIEKDRFSKKLLTDLEKLKETKWDSVSIIFSLDEKMKQELVSLLKMESIAFNTTANATDVSSTVETVRDGNSTKKKESDGLDGKRPQKKSDNPATQTSGIKDETVHTKKKAVKEKAEKKASNEPQYTVKDTVLKKFEGMIDVAELPEGITEIGKKAFASNPYIKMVIVPSGVKKIDDGAFEGCTGLEEIRLEDDVEYIGKKVFSGCTSLQSFRIPGNVTALFDETFKNCNSLKYIVIHKNVVYTDIFTFPYGNKIDFYGEYNELIRYQVEEQAKSISKQMPSNVEKPVCTLTADQIKKLDFIICGHELMRYLGHDKIVVVPDGVRTIAINAFRGSYKDEENTCEQILLPNSVTSIKRCAFDDQSQLQGLEIPYGVKTINMDIVSGCDNLKYITLPETVNTIDVCAFRYCRSLESVNIPKNVRKISNNAFEETNFVTIYGEYGSVAHSFALKHSMNFSTGLPAGVPKPRTKDDTRYEDAISAIKQEAEREKRLAEEREKQRQQEIARKKADEEARLAEEKRRVEEQKRQFRENTVKLKELTEEKEALLKTIAENKGLFGQKAKTRKEAKTRLSEVENEISRLSKLIQ